MGVIAYELVLLGILCIFTKNEKLIPIKKQLSLLMLSAGLFCTAYYFRYDSSSVLVFSGAGMAVLVLNIWITCTQRGKRMEVIHIPENSYEIEVVERLEKGVNQIFHYLKYQEQVYLIGEILPEDKPALILYVTHTENEEPAMANIAVDRKNEPLTLKKVLQRIRNVMAFGVAVAMPIIAEMGSNGIVSDRLWEAVMITMIGCAGRLLLRDGKTLFMKFAYGFCVFMEIMGWIGTLFGLDGPGLLYLIF